MSTIAGSSFGGEILVSLDKSAATPLHAQLEASIRDGIRAGRIAADSVVPASRRLADELGLSRGVVVEAYQQLTAEGYLLSRPGGYTRVAKDVAPTTTPNREVERSPLVDFRYGRPDVSRFPREAWLRSIRRVLMQTPHERFTYLDGRGAEELRVALAEYLNRVRGTWATPDNVVVANGFAQAFSLVVSVLASRGIRRLAVEDPSDADAHRVARLVGLEVVGIPITASGIDVLALEASGADAVLVTPAHQFPTGAVLAPANRTALLEWARRGSRFVIEDDYDAEYRYDQSPVGALHGLAPDHVIYAGTASKTLAPGLRLGWLVAPAGLVDDLARTKLDLDRGSPVIDQLAFADFLARGELDRHLRKMRPLYRHRRDVLLREMGAWLPELEPVGIAAGQHVFAWLPGDIDERSIIARARERGVFVNGVVGYQVEPDGRGGLVLGYGKLDEEAIVAGVRMMRRVIDER